MNQRCSNPATLIWTSSAWRTTLVLVLLNLTCAHAAFGQSTGSLDSFISPLKNGLNLIMVFGFIAGCVMVMSGFLNAKRDENWKMTVIYGIGVAGAVALMKALFAMFGGAASSAVTGF
ncbi:MAG: hypothetical protein JOZ61_08875 [Verrucomicrobia bacterium]|jgi:hypothetical protein|nr:hypothetical protein [Verrucomicrobiota bacterium]